jgi:ribA/ribD-fused uncharacterized protein
MIDRFTGEYFFLSNMYPLQYRILAAGSTAVNSAEAAYQAAKFLDFAKRRDVALVTAESRGRGERLDGIASKNFARELIAAGEPLQPNWQNVKLGVMQEVVRRKFIANFDIRKKLAATDGEQLIEGNTWNDTFWGVDLESGIGENHLGIILTNIRQEILEGKYQ